MPRNGKKHKNKRNRKHETSSHHPSQEIPSDVQCATLPYRTELSSIVGRYIVASRDLEPGELLMQEAPLAIGPCVSAEAVCLGCYAPVQVDDVQYRCPACKWPLCGPECTGVGVVTGHGAEECGHFNEHNTVAALNRAAQCRHPVAIKNIYERVLIVRILLMKQHDPARYEAIVLMESHTEMRKQTLELWQHYANNVVTPLQRDWGLAAFTADEIHTICGVLDVNCFEIGQKVCKARALYPNAFLLAHDCSPNTSHTDDPHTFELVLRTSRAILEDEAITLSYAYTLQGTLKRREFMYAGKLFWCSCERCADPFELGSDCSAIVCERCGSGSVRAADPLDQDAEWRCDSCEKKVSAKEIVRFLDKINNDLESIDVHDVPALEDFILRYSTTLRPNHYLFLSAKYSLCQVYGRIEGYLINEMSLDDIRRKERYCRDFLDVIEKLEPGLTRLRGVIMYELHAPQMVTLQRLVQAKQITKRDFHTKLQEVIELLRASRNILKMEPVGSNEHQMGLAAEEALKNIAAK